MLECFVPHTQDERVSQIYIPIREYRFEFIQSCTKHFLIQHQKSLPAQVFSLLPLFEFTSYSSCHLFSLNHVLPCAIYLRSVFSFFIYWLYFSSPSIISYSVTPFFNALL